MITRENYEVFYIDFLDGTLSKEMEIAFLSFLEANPDLEMEDELVQLSPSNETLSAFEKQLLKQEETKPLIISSETIEFALVAQLEKQLSEDEEKNLQLWLLNNPNYQTEQAIYAKTILAPSMISYENKNELYQHTRIIPLWLTTSAAAASIALIVGISAFYSPGKWNISIPGNINFSKDYTPKNQKGTVKEVENEEGSNSQTVAPKQHNYKAPKEESLPIAQEHKEDETPHAPNKSITNNRGTILPTQPEIADHITEKSNEINPKESVGKYVASNSMTNPIEPLTAGLSKQFKTEIDFKRQKETKESNATGFYLKIGKFEVMHKKGGKK